MFDSVFGHARIKEILTGMIQRDRLHHGLCFFGPSGIGKRLMAHEVARAMMCETRNACGACGHCRKLAGGNHPDFREVTPDGNDIKVDQIREIAEDLHFRPFEARARFIVLDRVERLREGAANAFLKSLEEPPDYVYFILVTSDIKALLPTIRSRCQQMGFQSLSDGDKKAVLEKRFHLDPDLAARLASISFRRLETEREAWDLFLADVNLITTFFDKMLRQGHAMDLFSEVVRDKSAFPRFLTHLTAVARQLTLLAAGLALEPRFRDFDERFRKLAAAAEVHYWRDLWERVARLHGQSRHNLNHSLWFNALSLEALGNLEKAAETMRRRLGAT